MNPYQVGRAGLAGAGDKSGFYVVKFYLHLA